MAKRSTSPVSATEPRIRFNWGFWDARGGAWTGERNRDGVTLASHFDQSYAAGARYGLKSLADGEQTETSEPAWLAARKAGVTLR